MAAAVVISPVSGSITHLTTACEVTCTGTDSNDSAAYDSTKYPSEPAIGYYFQAARTGSVTLKSNIFTTNSLKIAEWHDLIFPDAGTWTLTLRKSADDSIAATASVVVA